MREKPQKFDKQKSYLYHNQQIQKPISLGISSWQNINKNQSYHQSKASSIDTNEEKLN